MAHEPSLNDRLHLKGLIQSLTGFVKERNVPFEADTAEKFLALLLTDVASVDVSGYAFLQDPVKPRKRGKNKSAGNAYTPPKVSDLQKVLSGNVTLDKLEQFSRLVHEGAYDALFRRNMTPLVEAMAPCGAAAFYDELLSLCSLRFFTAEAYAQVCDQRHRGDDVGFLLALLRHGFDTLYNIPAYYGRRVYEQAQVFDYDSPVRYEMMREAAEGGVQEACLEYANYLGKREQYSAPLSPEEIPVFEKVFRYLLMAGNYDPALWMIAFHLGEDSMPKKFGSTVNTALRINAKIKTLDDDMVLRELNTITPNPQCKNPSCLMLAYKIHFYLAFKKDPYVKSLNSMGNMLQDGRVLLNRDLAGVTAEELAARYLNIAAGGHDVVAVTNRGSVFMKGLLASDDIGDLSSSVFRAGMEELETAAAMKMSRGLYNLAMAEAHIAIHGPKGVAQDGKDYAQAARKHLQEALQIYHKYPHMARELYYRLGVMESAQNEAERAEYFNKAAELGQPDAIYEVSLRKYLEDRHDSIALNSIRTNLSQVSSQMRYRRRDAEELICQIDKLL